ncbi:MAG: copper chaperone PCu(A)C [Burkholderiales bacterium]
MKRALAILALAVGSTGALAQADHVRIDNAYARATAPGAAVGGGYATIRNTGKAPDRLVGASSTASARTELHEMKMVDNVMRMREVRGIDVPANGSVELKPGGYHLMFMELKAPLKQGDKVPVTLKFEKAGELKVELEVRGMAAGSGHSSHGHGHGAAKKH